ncbi:uncharacterized protein B0H18DRAFT_979490 [Fomitopsis serialis]|uniref:uncharacterized protein n=1 Tax=Fomitopsis serialis TaxID=139415 RepID=UPI0020071FF4|nr:uncharacterized protein B0H18DRAFT_979490 [Neoantrodia serialis]KAH9935035.1 hypothetical protein B0H18DRAFT_979490 [Neoantrodia serialis]
MSSRFTWWSSTVNLAALVYRQNLGSDPHMWRRRKTSEDKNKCHLPGTTASSTTSCEVIPAPRVGNLVRRACVRCQWKRRWSKTQCAILLIRSGHWCAPSLGPSPAEDPIRSRPR